MLPGLPAGFSLGRISTSSSLNCKMRLVPSGSTKHPLLPLLIKVPAFPFQVSLVWSLTRDSASKGCTSLHC